MILTNLVFFTIALLLLMFLADTWLDALNAKEVRANRESVPEAFAEIIDEADYQKSARYTLDKISYSIYERLFGLVLIVAVLIFGVYPILFRFFTGIFGSGVWAQSAALLLSSIILSLDRKSVV